MTLKFEQEAEKLGKLIKESTVTTEVSSTIDEQGQIAVPTCATCEHFADDGCIQAIQVISAHTATNLYDWTGHPAENNDCTIWTKKERKK